MGEDGKFYRLYPISFRLLASEEKFKKFQWIEADLVKNPKDSRPESFCPIKGTIKPQNEVVTDWTDRVRLLQGTLIENLEDVRKTGVMAKTIVVTKLHAVQLRWVPNDNREKHLSNIQYHESGLFPPDKDDLAALKDLHIPENLLQVCWNDAKGNKHKHKLFEWEYYKTLSDLIRRGRTLEKAQNAVLESASKMRFNSEDHEIWGLFGTTKRDMAWILGSVFNPPSKNISAAKQNEMF